MFVFLFSCRQSAFLIGGFYRVPIMARRLHVSPPILFDDITICVHTAGLAAAWLNTFKVFEWSLWLGIICTLFVSGTIIFWFVKFEPPYHNQNYAWSLLTTFGFCIAMFTVKFEPQKVFNRIFMSTLLLLGINCYAVYTSSLIKILTHPSKMHQISTASDVVDQQLEIYGSINHLNYIKQYKSDDPTYNEIAKRFQVCRSNEECFKRFHNNSNSAIVSSQRHAIYNTLAPQINQFCFDAYNNLYTVSITVVSYPFHHLLKPLHEGIGQVVEGGLLYKWEQDIISSRPHRDSGNNGHVTLSIKHLQGAFILIGIGTTLAVIVFAIEWVFYYRSKGKEATLEMLYMIERRERQCLLGCRTKKN